MQDQLLSTIKVKGNAVGFRNYYLFHVPTSLNYQRLVKVEEKTGDDLLAYNPTVFGYDTTGNTDLFSPYPTTTISSLGSLNNQNSATVSGDFDADGKTDLIIYPITGPNAKNYYTLLTNITATNSNFGFTHNVGTFDDIFPTSFINFNNKLMPMQGWCIVKKDSPYFGNYTFTLYNSTYSSGTPQLYSAGGSKTVSFPTVTTVNFCDNDCNPNFTEITIPKKILSGDFNGDGITDVLALDARVTTSISSVCNSYTDENGYLQCSQSQTPYYSNNVYFINLDRTVTNSMNLAGAMISALADDSKVDVIDFNGDGKSDFMVINAGNVKVYTLNSNNQLILIANYSEVGIKLDKPLLIGDYNGDAKMDFCIPQFAKQDSWNFYFSNGKDNFIGKNTSIGMEYHTGSCDYINDFRETYFIASDFNADGKADIIALSNSTTLAPNPGPFVSNQNEYICQPYYSGTQPVTTEFVFAQSLIANPNQVAFSVNSIDENYGLKRYPIISLLNHNNPRNKSEFSLIQDNKIITLKQLKDSSVDGLLRSITTGNGVVETITYKPLKSETTNNYTSPNIYFSESYAENYPNNDIVVAPSFKVVSKLEKQSDNYYKKQLFTYYGAVSNIEGLGFFGFRASMRTNWVDANASNLICNITKSNIALRGASSGSFSAINLWNANASTPSSGFISKSINTYNTDASNVFEPPLQANKVFKLKNTKTEQFNGLESTSSSSVTVYDANNNPTTATTTIKNGTNIEQITTTTIGYNDLPTATPYIIGRPISKTQNLQIYPNQADADTTITDELYTFNSAQLLSKIEKRSTNSGLISNWLTEDNTYDTYGNITKKIITPFGETARETNYQYSATYGYRFMTKSIDVELLETEFTYDSSKGLVLTEKLPSISASFPLLTTYTYDNWGKKLTVKDYLNQTKTFTYTNTAGITTIASTATDLSTSSEIFDKLGRKTQSSIKNSNAVSNLNTLQTYQYDMYDRAFKTSDPYFVGETALQNETKYDTYGRVYQTIDSKGKITNITYSGLTTTVSDGTKTKISVKNALGNVISMTDSPIGGEVTYKYFANGNLKQTLYEGFATTITQDAWGRKKTLDDPSAGLYSYDYNGFGETLKETTPKGFTDYTYAPATGKLATKWVKDAITPTNTNIKSVYAYYPTNKLLNTITVTNPYDGNSTYLYGYDNYKRLNSTTETFLGTIPRSFVKTVTFDGFGRVLTETNTANAHSKTSTKTTNNTYRYGYLYQIFEGTSATGTPLWQANTENARGQLLTAAMGNGIGITNTYNPFGYVTKMKHDKTATATNIMTLNTDFDQIRGNLLERQNNMFANNESFEYDEQDRLTTINTSSLVLADLTFDSSIEGFTIIPEIQSEFYPSNLNGTMEITGRSDDYGGIERQISTNAVVGQQIKVTGEIFNLINQANNGNLYVTIYEKDVVTGATVGIYDTQNQLSDGNFTLDHIVTNYSTIFLRFFAMGGQPYSELYNVQFDNIRAFIPTSTFQTYEESGKIDTNSLGVYNYSKMNATPARPYQNTSVTLSTEGLTHYGSIGNQTITYNAFKSPIQITDGNKKITFGYNAMQDRSIMYYGDSNVTPSSRPYRKYYSGDGSMEVRYTKAMPAVGSTPAVLEKVEFFTYIGGDAYSAPLVARKVDAGTFENFYLHRDYQGSILAITNQQGVKVEERLFDAWGLLLKLKVNGVLSALPTAGVGLLLDRGYTGHEHLWTVALVHMNARLYDAKLHRFLQPDNFVQDPSSTQSFNRYAYCMNNPLMYTDTNGEFWHIVVGAVLGGVINWAMNGCQFNAQGLGYFGVGAAVGALTAMIGAGVSSSLAGGSFSAGALGTSSAWACTATSSFLNGAMIGSASGLAGGFASGLGNSLLSGQSIGDSFKNGIKEGVIGGISGGLIGGFAGGIDAALDGRRFWDGATVTKQTAVPAYTIKDMQQTLDASCTPTSGAAIDQSFGGTMTELDATKIYSADYNNIGVRDEYFWDSFSKKTNVKMVQWNHSSNDAEQLFDNIGRGGYYKHSRFSFSTSNHSVVLKSVTQHTIKKINGSIAYRYFYNVMDPAIGKSSVYNPNSVIHVFRLFK